MMASKSKDVSVSSDSSASESESSSDSQNVPVRRDHLHRSIEDDTESLDAELRISEPSQGSIVATVPQGRAKFDPKNERQLRMLLQATSTHNQIQEILNRKEYEHCSREQRQLIVRDALKRMVEFGVIDPEVVEFASDGYETYRNAVGQFLTTLVGDVSGSIVDNPVIGQGISALQLESVSGFQLQTPRLGLGSSVIEDSAIYGPKWQEMECLGKGGFGSVWACKNLLDGEIYAVKKIIITDQFLRVARINNEEARERALADLHHEVKVLAKLDHPNIVRYYGSWMEKMTQEQFDASKKNLCPDGLSQYYDEDYYEESDQVAESESGDEDDEDATGDARSSGSLPSQSYHGNSSQMDSLDLPLNARYNDSISGVNFFDETSAVSHHSADSGGSDLQVIPRPSGLLMDLIPVQQINPHVRILSIQMAKYALSLYDFIQTPGENAKCLEDFGFSYEFQPRIALELMLKIVEGVEYMHHYDLVHRDLKPANIFLKIERGAIGDMQGSVRVAGCKCELHGKICPKTGDCLPGSLCWVTPKIGDFGLTADIKRVLESTNKAGKHSLQEQAAVGTVLYTPPAWAEGGSAKGKSEMIPGDQLKSDVHLTDAYALGIIFFELLQRFGTISQRHGEISKLRDESRSHNPFPEDFCFCQRSPLSEEAISAIKSTILKLTCQRKSRMDIVALKGELQIILKMIHN